MNKQTLINMFDDAINGNFNYIGVAVKMPNCPLPEIIINPIENAATKVEYYNKAYDEELKLKTFPAIEIVGISCAHTIEDVAVQLVEATYE